MTAPGPAAAAPPSYAVARLSGVTMGPEIRAYLREIDATLAPFGGRFLVHGGPLTRIEGNWPDGDLVVLAFPSRAALEGWYGSPAYRRTLPLRTRHATTDVVFVDGVAEPHRATDILPDDRPGGSPGA
jgi:uncharacterized protein (DUF1330 family)